MKPRELFGDRCLHDYKDKKLGKDYNKLKHKDCVFLIWGDRVKFIIIEKDEDNYYCIFGSGQKLDVKYSLHWILGKEAWVYIENHRYAQPTIIDKAAYQRFKEYLVLEAI